MNKTYGVILVVSLMLNAFLIGKSLPDHMGPPMRGGPQEMEHPEGPPEAFFFGEVARKSRTLSNDGQAKIKAILAQYQTQDGASFAQTEKLFDEAHAALLADPFEPEKLAAIHQRIGEADVAAKKQIGDMMLAIAAALSKEDRLAFFKDMGPGHKPDGRPEPPSKDR
ncbi:MAG: periplasmic heavy metal sensor [Pseudobdellovibrionaceae bacterium]